MKMKKNKKYYSSIILLRKLSQIWPIMWFVKKVPKPFKRIEKINILVGEKWGMNPMKQKAAVMLLHSRLN